ncbi:hypothetical protein F4818DRAFT_425691 [Hypoxylon cercidicola]|nr:hypothetical protein F4818DRAFT_425691 [Hypoxylon cercidicola]
MRRPGRPKTNAVNAMQMLAIRDDPDGPEVLLKKQFRAPAGKLMIEFPAGLIDEGKTPKQATLRELREETGYVSELVADHRVPASSSSSTFLIHIKVDPSKPENQDPKP